MQDQLAVTEETTETTHTPGPWRVHPYPARAGRYNAGLDVGPDGIAVATVIGAFKQDEPGACAQANARLIAAAPELLAALRNLYEADRGGRPIGYQMEAAKAVLAKLE